jgi:hypothetical protein
MDSWKEWESSFEFLIRKTGLAFKKPEYRNLFNLIIY